MIRKSLIVAAALSLAWTAQAQDQTNKLVFQPGSKEPDAARIEAHPQLPLLPPTVSKTIDTFFAALQKNQIAQAYEDLTKGTKIAESPKDIVTLKSKTQQAIEMFGDIQGAERTGVQNVGSHLLRTTYVSLGKNFPLRWRFYFYRSAETWRLIDIRVDDRLMDMFDEPEKSPTLPPK